MESLVIAHGSCLHFLDERKAIHGLYFNLDKKDEFWCYEEASCIFFKLILKKCIIVICYLYSPRRINRLNYTKHNEKSVSETDYIINHSCERNISTVKK